jgi:peptidyl-prolyl cis-trans isomerase SurA
MMWRRATLAALLVATAMTATNIAPVHADVIERVVAIINDDAVFLSEIRRRAARALPEVMAAETREERESRMRQLYSRILDELVDDRLIAQAARRAQITVTTDAVDNAIETLKRQSRLNDEQFREAVREQGYTESQFREDVRRQLLRLNLLNVRVRGRINITDEDVRAVYDTEVRRARSQTTFVAADILVALEPGASATDIAAARRRAEAIHRSIGATSFEAAMAEHGGFELGELRQGQLDGALEEALMGLEDGGVSEPVLNAAGFHILLLRSRGHDAQQIPPFDGVREAIQRQLTEEAMGRQQSQYLEELRRDASVRKLL